MKSILSLFVLFLTLSTNAQNMVAYAGNDGKEAFMDIVQLSNGKFIISGYADNLDWISEEIPQTIIAPLTIQNELGGSKIGFIVLLNETLTDLEHIVYLPAGAAENIRFMKTTNAPRTATGNLFISGDTEDTRENGGGYFLGRLNGNFVDNIPTAFEWVNNIWAEGEIKVNHPWDVNNQNEVTYGTGQTHAFDFATIYKLDSDGQRTLVPNWRTHWKVEGGEYRGLIEDWAGDESELAYSGIVLKSWGRCDLRSWTDEEYNAILDDGNGGTKKGTWPLDILYNSPCDLEDPSTAGPGYTGYSMSGTPVYGLSVITVDRRDNSLYIGMNTKSVLPSGLPDFEPAVIKMTEDGTLGWWSRLYHEIQPDGEYVNSTPDQYVDGIAIDYSLSGELAEVVIQARCHGNNVENLWEGNEIAANVDAQGFQNRFTGTEGNIHISWIGKLKISDATLMHSSYVAEYQNTTGALGGPHPDPLLDNWPNPNEGWPDVNTTRLIKSNIKITADGSVLVAGTGRRTITTTNAYQKMVRPEDGGESTWNEFVRVYNPELTSLNYSSLIVGQWDTITQAGGDNTKIYATFKTEEGIVAVGFQKEDPDNPGVAKGNDLLTINVPDWADESPSSQSAIIVHYKAEEITNEADNPSTEDSDIGIEEIVKTNVNIYPNPAQNIIYVNSSSIIENIQIFSMDGRLVDQIEVNQQTINWSTENIENGNYLVAFNLQNGQDVKKLTITK